jgi:hypothetical protein
MMRKIVGIIGVLAALLGGLWLLQGLGMVHMKPIACVAECAPMQGPSATWAIAGGLLALLGLIGAAYGFRRR